MGKVLTAMAIYHRRRINLQVTSPCQLDNLFMDVVPFLIEIELQVPSVLFNDQLSLNDSFRQYRREGKTCQARFICLLTPQKKKNSGFAILEIL